MKRRLSTPFTPGKGLIEMSDLGHALDLHTPQSTPQKHPSNSQPGSGEVQRIRSNSISTPESDPRPAPKDVGAGFPLIRKQSVETVIGKLPPGQARLVAKVASNVGQIRGVGSKKNDKGTGSGFYLGNGLFLTSTHCVDEALGQQKVAFSQYGPEGAIGVDFELDPALVPDEEARELGFFAPPDSQMRLVRLLPHERHGDPKAVLQAYPLKVPDNPQPEHLLHFGFPGGTNTQMVSATNSIPVPLAEAIPKGMVSVGRTVTWNKESTSGEVVDVDLAGLSMCRVVAGNKRHTVHEFYVGNGRVVKVWGNDVSTVDDAHLATKIRYGHGHIVSANKSMTGNSGGIYVNLDGDVVGVHIGLLDEVIQASPDHHFYPHYVGLPYTSERSDVLGDYVQFEDVKCVTNQHMGQYVYAGNVLIGQIVGFESEKHDEGGNEYSVLLELAGAKSLFSKLLFNPQEEKAYLAGTASTGVKVLDRKSLKFKPTKPSAIVPKLYAPIERDIDGTIVSIYKDGDVVFPYNDKDGVRRLFLIDGHQEKHLSGLWPQPSGGKSKTGSVSRFPQTFGFKETVALAQVLCKISPFNAALSEDKVFNVFQIGIDDLEEAGLDDALKTAMGNPSAIELMDATFSLAEGWSGHFYPIN